MLKQTHTQDAANNKDFDVVFAKLTCMWMRKRSKLNVYNIINKVFECGGEGKDTFIVESFREQRNWLKRHFLSEDFLRLKRNAKLLQEGRWFQATSVDSIKQTLQRIKQKLQKSFFDAQKSSWQWRVSSNIIIYHVRFKLRWKKRGFFLSRKRCEQPAARVD